MWVGGRLRRVVAGTGGVSACGAGRAGEHVAFRQAASGFREGHPEREQPPTGAGTGAPL